MCKSRSKEKDGEFIAFGRFDKCTNRINSLTKHMQQNPKDFHSNRGLLKMVGHRRNLLNYLKKKDIERYRAIIAKLGLRK